MMKRFRIDQLKQFLAGIMIPAITGISAVIMFLIFGTGDVSAARLWSSGFEMNTLTDAEEFDVPASTGLTISSATKRSGTYALRHNSTSAGYIQHQWQSANADDLVFVRLYVYAATLHTGGSITLLDILDSSNATRASIRMTTTGALQLYNASTQVGSDSSALSTGRWYRIELKFDSTQSAGSDILEARINGTSFASSTTQSLSTVQRMRIGAVAAGTGSPDVYFDDIALNDDSGSAQTSWPGAGNITHLRPNAAGDGADGTRGGSDSGSDYGQIDESDPNDVTDYYILDSNAGTDRIDVNIESSATGGIDSLDTVTLVQVGVRVSCASAAACAYNARVKSQSSGTLANGSTVGVAVTSWHTQDDAVPRNYFLTSYTDPQAGGAWTSTLLDAAQIGVLGSDANPDVYVSTLWALVEYVDVPTTLYWVGGNGDSPTTSASDWSTTDPGACNDGGGDASAVPSSAQTANFDADCDNGASMTADWNVGAITMSSGYSGTIATKGYEIDVAGALTVNGGTLDATDTGGEGDKTIISVTGNVDFTGGDYTEADSTLFLKGTGSVTFTSGSEGINNLTLNDGLVGYWKMDETAANSCTGGSNDSCDSSGFGHDGAWVGTAASSTDVPSLRFQDSGSVTLDGNSDVVLIPRTTALEPVNITITAWFNSNSFASAQAVVTKPRNGPVWSSPFLSYMMRVNSSTLLEMDVGNTTYSGNGVTVPTLSINTWYHLALSYDGTNLRSYLNGSLIETDTTVSGNITYGSSPLIIGGDYGASPYSSYFNGEIDEVRIYNRVLSDAEIAALAAGTHPATAASGSKITLEDTLDVNGNLTINSGQLDTKSTENNAITLAGSWLNNGGIFTPQSGTVTLDGTSGTGSVQGGNQGFNQLTVNGSGGTWQLIQDAIGLGTTTVSNGTLNLNGYGLVESKSLTVSGGTLNLGIGTSSVQGTIDFTGGTVTPSSSTLVLNPSSSSKTLTAASQSLNNLLLTSTDGLVAWWKMDETAFNGCSGGQDSCDSSGNSNHGTESGTVTISTETAPVNFTSARGLSFDGVNDYVSAADSSSLRPTTLTIAAWVKPSTLASNDVIVSKPRGNSSAFDDYWLAFKSTGQFEFCMEPAAETDCLTTTASAVSLRNWAHVAAVWDGATMRVFKNGVVDPTTAAHSSVPIYGTSSVYIGAENEAGVLQSYFNGIMDDVRIYNRALTSDEIAALYRGHPLSATGTITLQDTLDVNGNVILGDGTLAPGSNTITAAQSWTASGAAPFTGGTGTVNFDGASGSHTITAPGMTFNDMTVSGAGTWTISSGGATIADDLTVSAGTLNLGIGTSSVSGNIDFTGGTITPSSSTLVLSPSAAGKTLTAASETLNNVVLTSTDGLVGWWKMDETAFNSCSGGEDTCDSSGNGYHGTESGTPTISSTVAPVNFTNTRSLSFDGTDDYIDLSAHVASLRQASGSICAWVKTTTDTNQNVMMFCDGAACSTFREFAVGDGVTGSLTNEIITFDAATNKIGYTTATRTELIDGKWHHVCMTAGSDYKIYLDGASKTVTVGLGSNDGLFTSSTSLTAVNIGRSPAGGNRFTGQIDDLRYYNRALTASEVAALYWGHPLSQTGGVTLQDNLDVNGNVVLGDGTLNASSRTISVAQNWTNSAATFTYGTSTVDFDDDAKNNTISGSTTFYNFKIDTGTAKTVTFESGATQSIAAAGTLTLKGAVGQILTLAPGTAATDWGLTLNGSACSDIQYVTTTYSDASGGEIVDGDGTGVTADGTNTNWCTGSCTANCGLAAAVDTFFFGSDF